MRFDFHNFDVRSDPRLGQWYVRAGRQPSWVWKLAIFAAVFVFVVPILLLAAGAALIFALVFLVFAGVHRIGRLLSAPFATARSGPAPTRRNVRVIEPRD